MDLVARVGIALKVLIMPHTSITRSHEPSLDPEKV